METSIATCHLCGRTLRNHPGGEPCRLAPSSLQTQVGGDHYRGMAIQPIEYIHKNGLPFIEGAVVKYVSRWRLKGGVDDLKKARHCLDLLIEMETQALVDEAGL